MKKLEPIPIKLHAETIQKRLRLKEEERVKSLLERVTPVISGQALYHLAYIEEKTTDRVKINGIEFKSLVLRKNLDLVERVFPFVITIGPGLEKEIEKTSNILDQFSLDAIGNIALGKARQYLEDHIKTTYRIDKLSFMSPGSLKDWPLEEQKTLFSTIPGIEKIIGVKLTKSLLMIPKKSVSGIFFQTEVNFYNCQLCPREKCPGRKAAYSQELVREYGILEQETAG